MRRLLVLVAFLLVPPAAARAAEVAPGSFRAAPGEANAVVITRVPHGVRFVDEGARVQATEGCRRIDAHTARCPSTSGGPTVRLGDEDDALRVRGLKRSRAFGGGGGDDLRGGRGADLLDGGKGPDTLRSWGDDAADRVRCGGGAQDIVMSESLDRISGCETLRASGAYGISVDPLPLVDAANARFTTACERQPGCSGALTLTGPDGEAYGGGPYRLGAFAADAVVSVPLTAAGKAAIRAGAPLAVDVAAGDGGVYGYRVTLP